MGLDSLKFQTVYETHNDNVIDDFYIPCLQNSSEYDVITGFFDGRALKMLATGLCPLVTSGGKMKIILSTEVNEKDAEAISNGYKQRESFIEERLLKEWEDPTDEFEKSYLSLLSYLIASGTLDVKIGIVSERNTSILHQKVSIFRDRSGNSVVAQGSGNLTPNGLFYNSEVFDVYCSWNGEIGRCTDHALLFRKKWNGNDQSVQVIPFPEAVKRKILTYSDYVPTEELGNLDKRYRSDLVLRSSRKDGPNTDEIDFFDYQKEAIGEWKKNGYRGYLDMATGTGKTITALGAAVSLINERPKPAKRYFLFIIVPQTALVDQWGENCEKFGIMPLLCYGNSKKWLSSFLEKTEAIKAGISPFEAVVITQDSALRKEVLDALEKVAPYTIFIGDEAHNLGATQIGQILKIDFRFRLGLSATIQRHFDDAGTQKILSFFGTCLIHLPIHDAIKGGKLCHYLYHPVLVSLSPTELDDYKKLSKRISKAKAADPDDDFGRVKDLLIKRSRIVAGASQKAEILDSLISPFENKKHILVYCGSETGINADDEQTDKQIDDVKQRLESHHMLALTYTAKEKPEERKKRIRFFIRGEINALVAIRCLDEGVDIPCIETAFILASTTNPKQYIQRRGRLLRIDRDNKDKIAQIYDFVTISRPLDDLKFVSDEVLQSEKGLVKRELQRVEEFYAEADNAFESFKLKDQLISAYGLDEINIWEDEDDD